jgi:hypothetical protein
MIPLDRGFFHDFIDDVSFTSHRFAIGSRVYLADWADGSF